MKYGLNFTLIATVLITIVLVAGLSPASGSVTYGRWRDINPTQYSGDTLGTLRGIYVRNGGTGAIGAGDAWAVGGDLVGITQIPIISHYDGFSWQILGSPVSNAILDAAHFCTAPGAPSVGLCSANGDGSDGWIVGGVSQGLGGTIVALYWDGTALTTVNTGLGSGFLTSVFMVCHSPPFGTGCPSGPSFTSGLTFAAGTNNANGVIYQFNGNPKAGGGWGLQFTSALTTTFNGIYMYVDQAGNLAGFAVGGAGVVARLNGGTWTESVVAPAVTFRAVFVDQGNPADAWAVGDGGRIWRFASGIWTGPVSPGATSNNLFAVFLTSTNEGWIVGAKSAILHSTTIGSSNVWTALTTPIQTATGLGIDLQGLGFANSGSGWAVGTNGVILQTSNSGCTGVPAPCWGGSTSITQAPTSVGAGPTPSLNTVFMRGSNDAWAGGLFDTASATPALVHWDGSRWHRVTVAPLNVAQPDIYGIFMISSNEGWAVGGNSVNTPETLLWDGSSWTGRPIATPCACYLRALYMISGGTSGDGWAVGNSGQIFRYQSGSWGLFTTVPLGPQLNAVFINNFGSNNVNAGWAVGNGGTVLKLSITGGSPNWNPVGPILGVTQNLNGLYFTDANHGWIVGDSATILTTTDGGNTWSGGVGQVTGAPAGTNLKSAFIDTFGVGSGNGDGWAVGEDGTSSAVFVHWDGSSWVVNSLAPPPAVSPIGLGLRSVYLTSPTDGFAVGAGVIVGGAGFAPLSGIFHLDPPNPPTQVSTTTVTSTSSLATSSATTSMSTSSSTTQSTTSSSTESSTSTASVTVSTSVTTQVTTELTTSSATTPLTVPAVPGFPIESIIAGIIVGLTALAIMRRRKSQLK